MQGVAGQLTGARAWGRRGAALGRLKEPQGLVVTSSACVWVLEHDNHRLTLLH